MGAFFRKFTKIDQRQGPRRRGQEKMLCHGGFPGEMAMAFFLSYCDAHVYSNPLIPFLGAFAPSYRYYRMEGMKRSRPALFAIS
jgi:hypothetical protein